MPASSLALELFLHALRPERETGRIRDAPVIRQESRRLADQSFVKQVVNMQLALYAVEEAPRFGPAP